MKNVQYASKEIEVLYKELINNHQGLTSVINSLIKKNQLKILDITNDDGYIVNIKADLSQEIINIIVNYRNNKIYVVSALGQYRETYNNFPHKDAIPIECEYNNGTKSIVKQNYLIVEDGEINKYYYEIKDHGNRYNLLIIDKDGNLEEKDFIEKILFAKVQLSTIRDLLVIILNDINNKSLDIKICDDKGSIIEIDEGDIINYQEVFDVNGEYQKVFLKDNEFYISKKIEEIYQDNLTSYIKKIGEFNGKEKR